MVNVTILEQNCDKNQHLTVHPSVQHFTPHLRRRKLRICVCYDGVCRLRYTYTIILELMLPSEPNIV